MFKQKKQMVTTFIFALVFSLVSVTGTAYGKITSSSHLDYVSLGDSLASGHTPYGDLTGTGYTDIIASRLSSAGVLGNYSKYGVSGYTTLDVLHDLPNQLKSIRQAEIVTLDIGANDVLPYLTQLQNAYAVGATPEQIEAIYGKINTAITNVGGNIQKIIAQIKGINKNTKVYVMGYYNAFPYLHDNPLYPQVQLLIKSLNYSIQTAAASSGATYVDTIGAMECNSSSILNHLPNPADIHPDSAGYEVIANEFWYDINADFIKIP